MTSNHWYSRILWAFYHYNRNAISLQHIFIHAIFIVLVVCVINAKDVQLLKVKPRVKYAIELAWFLW